MCLKNLLSEVDEGVCLNEVILVNCIMKLVMTSMLRIMYKGLIRLYEVCKVCDVINEGLSTYMS